MGGSGTALTLANFVAVVKTAAIMGAAFGGISAAINGGNILEGMASGALSAAIVAAATFGAYKLYEMATNCSSPACYPEGSNTPAARRMLASTTGGGDSFSEGNNAQNQAVNEAQIVPVIKSIVEPCGPWCTSLRIVGAATGWYVGTALGIPVGIFVGEVVAGPPGLFPGAAAGYYAGGAAGIWAGGSLGAEVGRWLDGPCGGQLNCVPGEGVPQYPY
jgi:hypothetical protein